MEKKDGEFRITLRADVYAKSVCLGLREADCVFSDNWFDLHGGEPVTVTAPAEGETAAMTAETFRQQLTIRCY